MSRQADVLAWALETFGPIALDRHERAMRLVEEAIEVGQAEGLDVDAIHRLVERTFSRPPGRTVEEIGAVQITLDALAENVAINVDLAAQWEFDRVRSKPREWWVARQNSKADTGIAERA